MSLILFHTLADMLESILERFVGRVPGCLPERPSSTFTAAGSGEWARLNEVEGVIMLREFTELADTEFSKDLPALEDEAGQRVR